MSEELKDSPRWMYHADFPSGKLFPNAKSVPKGWVDTPAKIKVK